MSDRPERYLEQAERLYEIGQYDGAIDLLRRALTVDPDLADAHAWLAMCLLHKRRVHAAKIEADLALTLEAESPFAHWVAAEVCIARRELAAAERHAELLIAARPELPAAYRLLARCYLLTGRSKKRLPLLEEALRRSPEDPETLADVAEYHAESGDLAAAWRYADQALRIAPENQSALVAMGSTLLARGDVQGARDHALQALRADPTNPGALRLLTAVKTRSNPLLGLWWRYATWCERVGPAKQIVVLLAAYAIQRFATIAALGADRDTLASGISYAWLAICVYSFVGPALFRRALQKELTGVSLGRF
jgi:tetratricopeptide (TPR) repeat protein